jgi:hypothetical protein
MARFTLMIAVFCVAAAAADAQTSTGRHRAQPAEPEPTEAEAPGENPSSWYVIFGAGLTTSGDLARIRTANGVDQTWDPPAGQTFASADYTLTLDEGIGLAVALGRRLGSRLALRLDFSAAELPMTALARVGESAEAYRWDELAVMIFGLSAEYRLARAPSHLFLLAGGTATVVSGNRSSDYDQTRAGLRIGGGYHLHLGGDWGLRGEIRDTIQSLDFADYEPPVPEGAPYPDVRVENLGPQHVVELVLALHGSF